MLDRSGQRRGFLISALVHSAVLMSLAVERNPGQPAIAPAAAPVRSEPSRKVFMPSPSELRRLSPALVPKPMPPPTAKARDRISVGRPSTERSREPLILRREDDLTAVPKGTPSTPQRREPSTTVSGAAQASPTAEARSMRPPSLRDLPFEEASARGRQVYERPSIASATRQYLEQRLQGGESGLPSGTGRQMGPLFFDPEGADFTAWINQFKNEVYRNWLFPQAAMMGFKGAVDIEFTVARDGTLAGLRLVSSSGTVSLDRAAQNALQAANLLALPSDYTPASVTMQVRFIYG